MTKRSASAGPPRGLSAALAAAGLLTVALAVRAQEAPTGLDPTLPQVMILRHGVIEGGAPEIGADGKAMTIRQTTPALKLDWQRFDIGQGHAVRFDQPGKDAFVVNRVIGATTSQIDGALTANGRVYVINPKGVLFGKEASVDVGGLVASAAFLPDEDMAGDAPPRRLDPDQATSDIENTGRIVVRDGGLARMEGIGVRLQAGSRIEANGGKVELRGSTNAAMENGATVQALGGAVVFRGEEQITLGHVVTHDLSLVVNTRGGYRAKDKTYDGTSLGEVEPGGRVEGIDFTADSSLSMSYRFRSPEPGRWELFPDVQFREWAGEVKTGGRVSFPESSFATIRSLSPSERRRIDLPVLEKATVGKVAIGDPVGRILTIRQTSPFALLDWKSFNVAEGRHVRFEQPDPQALVVNRVAGEASRIHGLIEANGDVFLINPQGISFSRTARVSVGSLLAAALSSSSDAWSDDARSVRPLSQALQGAGAASVSNQGEITIAQGGVATLAAPGEVVQTGRISAPEGAIHLASTERVTLARAGRIQDVGGARRRIDHTGISSAEDGDIAMFGGERDQVAGVVRATGKGRIRLEGTLPGWDLRGDIQPGASMLLSDVIFQLDPVGGTRPSTLHSNRVEQWLNAGSDVEIRRAEGQILEIDGPSLIARSDAKGVLGLTAGRVVLGGTVQIPRLRLPTPLLVRFEAKDKPFDGNAEAWVDNAAFVGLTLHENSNLHLRPRYRFASAEPGRHLVSAEVDLVGFNGDEALPLAVAYDGSAQDLARRTASILPRIKPPPTPTPARVEPPLAVRRAVACEARRDVVRALDCDDAVSAPIAPAAASAPVLMDRGIRAPR